LQFCSHCHILFFEGTKMFKREPWTTSAAKEEERNDIVIQKLSLDNNDSAGKSKKLLPVRK
jgi:hypothetical protein